jgi:Outer membrane protein beta-barrel domain
MTRGRESISVLVLSLALAIGWGSTAQAHQGWFVGGGFARVSAAGDLDGQSLFVSPDGTEAIVNGSLDPGLGFVIDGGYGFNPYIAFEAMVTESHHNATAGFGLSDSTANVTNTLLGIRLTYPASEQLDLFARIGLAGSTVKYTDYGFQGTTVGNIFTPTNSGNATFTGGGTGIGIGAEYFVDHLGIGLGLTRYNISFDQASGISFTGSLSPKLQENFTVLDLTFLYHFF